LAGSSSGAIKGWITRFIRKKQPEKNFQMIAGILSDDEQIQTENDVKQFLIEDHGISPESNLLKGININAYGDVEISEIQTEEDGDSWVQIERYYVPPGVWVPRKVIKSWIRTKGITPRFDTIKTMWDTGYSDKFEDRYKFDPEDEEKKIDSLAYVIAAKWHREGYYSKMTKTSIDDKGREFEYRDKYAPNYVLDKYGNIERIEPK
jgi:hypothetical protein